MSRSGYIEDYADDNPLAFGRWRGVVRSATRGKRGQEFLREMLAALDKIESKTLIARELQTYDGGVCAIGAWGAAKGINMMEVDPEDYYYVAGMCPVATALVQEIIYMNDEGAVGHETPAARYDRMRAWVKAQLVQPTPKE
jgi:hypothetical protein